MKHLDDKRQFFDMQEHPENYSDEQLEQIMADLDKEPDAETAWERLEKKSKKSYSSFFTLHSSFERIAAAFLAAAFLGVLSFAGYRAVSDWHGTARKHVEADTLEVKAERFYVDVQDGDTIFRFENIRLDSILAVVSRHYSRQVVFRDKASQHLRFYMTCHTTQSLDEFVEMLNMFEGFKLSQRFDIIFVDSDEKKEGKR